jgi:hypothetical protein
MKKPKRSRGDRDNNPKHSFSVTRGNFGRVAPLHMTGTTPQSQPKVDADMAAGEEAVSPVTQPAAAVDSATTQNNVSRGDVASETAQSSAAGFPGEILENTEATSVDAYAVEISTAWHRTVNAVMTTAQFCARADARLTLQQKQELIGKLPFGEETFSKLVGIGNDLRLRQPEIQRRLPPYYTSIYVITTFNPDEFRLAVDLQVIHAEVTCGELEQWRNEHRQEAQEEQVAARTAESTFGVKYRLPPSRYHRPRFIHHQSRCPPLPVTSQTKALRSRRRVTRTGRLPIARTTPRRLIRNARPMTALWMKSRKPCPTSKVQYSPR